MGKTKQQKIKTLAEYIIDKTDTDKYRAGTLGGWKHLKKITELMEAVGGRNNLMEQACFLEKNTKAGRDGRFVVERGQVNTEIRRIDYEISVIPELCKLEKREDTREHQIKLISIVERWREDARDYKWVCEYYDDILKKLVAGEKVPEAEDEQRFHCINEIAKIKEPVWERVFSARVLQDSKLFEKNYRKKMVTILKNHSPYYEDGMEDYDVEDDDAKEDEKESSGLEILKIHGILSYAQTLEWKGALQYQLDEEKVIDTTDNIYGTVLNTQTLEHSRPVGVSGCRKIMTIENKANYESMPYEEGTLYIFCHGYFTPKEVRFLKQLCAVAPENCEFYHWGDMDFGGISIFQFIRKKVFPELKPYRMGEKDFKEALEKGAGIPLKASTREKLEKKEAGLLTELKEVILQTGMTIEQERLL